MADGIITPCNVACGSGIVTVNSPSGSTPSGIAIEFAQTSAISEFYIWFRFPAHHRSRHVILHQSAKFLSKSDHSRRKKNDIMSILKMADLSHLGF